jgi:hypothetical protein
MAAETSTAVAPVAPAPESTPALVQVHAASNRQGGRKRRARMDSTQPASTQAQMSSPQRKRRSRQQHPLPAAVVEESPSQVTQIPMQPLSTLIPEPTVALAPPYPHYNVQTVPTQSTNTQAFPVANVPPYPGHPVFVNSNVPVKKIEKADDVFQFFEKKIIEIGERGEKRETRECTLCR